MTTSSRRCASAPARRRPRLLLGAILGLTLGISLIGAAARAEEPLSFKERYERAVAIFKSGQYDDAIKQFQALYQEKPLALLLFNLAQSHKKAGHPREALDLYERFLREDPKTDLKAETEGYIEEMKAAIKAEEEAARKKAEEERTAKENAAALQKALAEEPPPAGFDRYGRRLQPPSRPLRTLKWVAAGAGVLAVGAGAALLALNGRGTCVLRPGQELCREQLDTLVGGAVGLGVGGLLLAGAVALFVIDHKQSKEYALAPRPRLLPALALKPGPTGGLDAAALTIVGSF